jgi:hypothetical protein
MLKQCTAFVLLLAFMTTTFSKAFIVVDFYANREYIARNLCENRDKPLMHCGGRCQLCKRLNREADQDKNNPEQRPENKQEVLFFGESNTVLGEPAIGFVDLPYSYFTDKDPVDRGYGIFHPPVQLQLDDNLS